MLVPFKREHVAAMHIKDSEAEDMACEGMAASLEWLERTGNGKTLFAPDNKTVLGVMGVVPMTPGVCEVFVIPSKEQARYAKLFASEIKKELWAMRPKFRRIQAVARPEQFYSRWLSWLGFSPEGVLRKYGLDGKDMLMWSIV